MKTIFFLSLYFSLIASTVEMKYVGELSLFGKVGNATIEYYNDGKNYHIKLSGGGTGILATLTKHKRYTQESIGRVENGVLIPLTYIGKTISHDYNRTKEYMFDYENSQTKVITTTQKNKEISTFNIKTFSYDTTYELITKEREKVIDKLYKDDVVSLFFNQKNKLLGMNEGSTYFVQALGNKDVQKGMYVTLINIEDGKYTYSLQVEKDYLTSGSEQATFTLDSKSILYESKLAGIMFFGDAVIRRGD